MTRRVWPALAFLILQSGGAVAGAPPDKSGFNLFRPVPAELLREITTDRPDKTESPITVDAGHFQIETDIVNYTSDRSEHAKNEAFAVAATNCKIGVLNNVDLQVIVESYNWMRTKDFKTGKADRASGFGDVTLRLKTNFWGNDSGPTAFGMMPFVKLPTGGDDLGNGAVEGGMILPLLVRLPSEWELGTMVEVDQARNSAGDGYHQEFIYSITLGHDIARNFDGYVELFSNVSNEAHSAWVVTLDCGVGYRITPNVQLDAGVNIGLTEAADDFNPFIGLSIRY
ncbi:MAG: hypothetical protein QOJ05_1419 [Verrucomicrobiota bacterium]